jgi:hypothetical protein
MLKLIAKTLCISLISMTAFAEDILVLDSARGETQVAVFDNSEMPKPRCLCATFSVLVKENLAMGAPAISEIKIIRRRNGEVVSEDTLQNGHNISRCLGSPWYTDQSHVMRNAGVTIEIQALAHRCMNPTEPVCKEKVVLASGEYSIQDLRALKELSPREVLARLNDGDTTRAPHCR